MRLPTLMLRIAAWSIATANAASSQTTRQIPLIEGLMLTNAIENPRGDYETHQRVEKIDKEAVYVVYTAPNTLRRRTITYADLDSSRHYQARYGGNYPDLIANTTGIGTSKVVLNELKTRGRAEFSCCFLEQYDNERLSGTLRVIEPRRVLMQVIVNDQRVQLPAIRAAGRLGNKDTEFYFLDDPANPIALQWKVGNQGLRLIRISFPTKDLTKRMERELKSAGHVDVYGIYFAFGSATIAAESEPVLQEIATVMKRNPGWKLRVDGHTDSIGGSVPNLDLSRRRAAAVKQALVARYSIASDRLTTDGFGASRPKATNSTLEGRALNRRVELVKR
jgi:outer membrane protein OmpA-like peptidoglycan-associated protein